MNYNKSVIAGRVTQDPQLRSTPGGQSVLTMGIATNRTWTDRDQKKREETEFHNVVVWGKLAETASRYLQKGSTVLVEGRLQTRSYDDKDGVARKVTEIVASEIQFGPKPATTKPEQGTAAPEGEDNSERTISLDDENEEDSGRDLEPLLQNEEEIKPEDIPF